MTFDIAVARLWTFGRAAGFCAPAPDVRGLGTCIRGTAGCQVEHAHAEPLPTILHRP